ncbi:alpha/beta fold hydrolase [Allosediminivita pacifica]|uniref:Pimeloyl-ACP methyl ester carboxylesterase n=1 Tax=Allosediminivita pacifica TaxID=1267769 RepID=A0A2T6B7U6_9RHOB|nr:alpha/beta hydrolase [Allosediminivita pacifica]PTX52108.1 pimeloyl-ACP methyl ester carboxylesterase [Allosediminivita pacifica]GGA97079.1 hydrolase [Allosediminivita pacifica]
MPNFTTSDGIDLYYTDEGEGLPLLCLAGLSRDQRDFDFVAPHLERVRLIRMDYRGRGQSAHADPATYTIPREGQDALELLDHLNIDKAAVLGTSRGGLIAMALAATAKERLSGVALNDVGPVIGAKGLKAIDGYLGRDPVWASLEEAAAKRPKVMEAAGFFNVPASRWREEVERLFVETPEGLDLPYDRRLRDAVLANGAQPAPDLWPLFDALAGLPLCTIRGANSDLLEAATFEEMKRRRPDMVATEVPDRGHIPFLDEPESLDALTRWLGMIR